MRRIYLASSWRNEQQPEMVEILKSWGHLVYDFRNPLGKTGFSWSDIDPNWKNWDADEYVDALNTPIASHGFLSDMRALEWCDTCVLLLPCGRSAHLEGGYAKGRGKRLIIYTCDGEEPELMALMADHIVTYSDQLKAVLT